MNELYFWLSALIVGIVLLKGLPAEKLTGINQKLRSKMNGGLLAVLYVLVGVFLFGGVYLLCLVLSAPTWLTYILSGSVIGAFIGLIPLVDKRHSNNNNNKL